MEGITPNDCVCEKYKYHQDFLQSMPKDNKIDTIIHLNNHCITNIKQNNVANKFFSTLHIFPFNIPLLLVYPTYKEKETHIYGQYKSFEHKLIDK